MLPSVAGFGRRRSLRPRRIVRWTGVCVAVVSTLLVNVMTAGAAGSAGLPPLPLPSPQPSLLPTLYLVTANGTINNSNYFTAHGIALRAPIVGITATPDEDGYWLVGADGGVFAFGEARYFGSVTWPLNSPVVGMAATPDGNGYWLVGADGGVFAFGDARYFGAPTSVALTGKIVGIAPTATGDGYWLAASDGGVFAYGDARYFGSMAGRALDAPVIGIAATDDSHGYWLDAADGGVFAFGGAPFYGAALTGPLPYAWTVGSVLPAPQDLGYWLVEDGDEGFNGIAGQGDALGAAVADAAATVAEFPPPPPIVGVAVMGVEDERI